MTWRLPFTIVQWRQISNSPCQGLSNMLWRIYGLFCPIKVGHKQKWQMTRYWQQIYYFLTQWLRWAQGGILQRKDPQLPWIHGCIHSKNENQERSADKVQLSRVGNKKVLNWGSTAHWNKDWGFLMVLVFHTQDHPDCLLQRLLLVHILFLALEDTCQIPCWGWISSRSYHHRGWLIWPQTALDTWMSLGRGP